jgi:hypothetical protein
MLPRLIAVLLVLTLAMPMLVAQQKSAVSDDAISDNVRQKLASDADVRGASSPSKAVYTRKRAAKRPRRSPRK